MGFPIVSTITPLYLSKFTDFWPSTYSKSSSSSSQQFCVLEQLKEAGWLLCFGEYCDWILFNCNSTCPTDIGCSSTPLLHELSSPRHMSHPLWQKQNSQKRNRTINHSHGDFCDFYLLKYLIVTCGALTGDVPPHPSSMNYNPHATCCTLAVAETEQQRKEAGRVTTPVVSFAIFICSNI